MEVSFSYVSHPTVLALNLPSCAILAVDSRIYKNPFLEAVSDSYDKIIELHPTVFLGCFGDYHVIDQVRVALLADLPIEDRSMGEIALFVQNTVNTVLDNSRNEVGEINREARFVLLGRAFNDSRYYFYNISKGENTWMYFAKREVGNVVCAGSDAVTTFLGNNKLDENMTEDEAVVYASKCMRYAVLFDWCAGGRIQVVAMKPGSSIVHTWVQNDPSLCYNEYHYQEPRITKVIDDGNVPAAGKRVAASKKKRVQ